MKAVKPSDKLSSDDLAKAAGRESDGRAQTRILAIRYMLLGHTAPEAATVFPISDTQLRMWVRRHDVEGLEGLRDRPRRSGRLQKGGLVARQRYFSPQRSRRTPRTANSFGSCRGVRPLSFCRSPASSLLCDATLRSSGPSLRSTRVAALTALRSSGPSLRSTRPALREEDATYGCVLGVFGSLPWRHEGKVFGFVDVPGERHLQRLPSPRRTLAADAKTSLAFLPGALAPDVGPARCAGASWR